VSAAKQALPEAGPKPTLQELWRAMGPAWFAAGLNIGGATLTNGILLAAATGFRFSWVIIIATFANWIATYACVYLTMITRKNPITLIKHAIHPSVGWFVGAAVIIVNFVFHCTMATLGGMFLSVLIPVSQPIAGVICILIAAAAALLATKRANDVIQKSLKWMVYILTASFVVSMFIVDIDWRAMFSGLFTFQIPTTKESVLLFTALMGAALAINVPTIQAFATKAQGMGVERAAYFKFETLITNIFLLVVQLVVIAVVASTLFPAGIRVTTAYEAALSLEPIAGRFSTILFSIGMLGAIVSTLVAQTFVFAYVLSDTVGWKLESGTLEFKLLQGVLLAIAATVPLFGWNPFSLSTYGAAFNNSFMPIGIAVWWYLMNRKSVAGNHRADSWLNMGLALAFLIALVSAVRFWYVTLS